MHPLSLSDPMRAAAGFGALGVMPPPKPDQVLGYQITAASAATVAARAAKRKRTAGIAGAIAASVGTTIGLSVRGEALRAVGFLVGGAGAALLGIAWACHRTEQQAAEVRDAFAKPLLAGGHPVPGVPEIMLDKGAP